MTRARLPDRRPNLTFEIAHPGDYSVVRYAVTIGLDADRAAKEVFISCNKVTTALDIAGRDIAILASIALQRGASLAELAGSISRDDNGAPQGVAGAVLDAVIAEIGG